MSMRSRICHFSMHATVRRETVIWLFILCLLCLRGASGHERSLPTDLEDPVIGSEKGTVHVVTSMECFKSYFIYQALVLKHSFDKVGQPGKVTRLISCSEKDAKENLSEEDLSIMDTLVVPNWKRHPITGDYYQPYNKPVSMIFWLAERKPTAEWTLIVDPDMIFKQPFRVEDFAVPEGFAVSAHYNYLIGGNNALADRHIPEVPRKDDHYGGPAGRRADESGCFVFIRTRDLAKIAPLWLSYTEAVRDDPNSWNLTGDTHLKKGGKAWISEMYGYIFGAARAGIRHKIEPTVQYYPGYHVKDIPILVHYGLLHRVGNYTFSKHQHFDFDPLRCPPWNMTQNRTTEQDAGLFLHPPFPSVVTEKEPKGRYGDLLTIDVVNTINKALCERHRSKCLDQMEAVERECRIVDAIERDLEKAFQNLYHPGVLCHDNHELCYYWSERGECENTWMYMTDNCRASCQRCRTYHPPLKRPSRAGDSPTAMSRLSGNPVEAVEKLRCRSLGTDAMLDDPRCRPFVKEQLQLSGESGPHHLQIVNNSMDVSSFLLMSCASGVFFVGLLIYAMQWMTRRRHRHRPKSSRLGD